MMGILVVKGLNALNPVTPGVHKMVKHTLTIVWPFCEYKALQGQAGDQIKKKKKKISHTKFSTSDIDHDTLETKINAIVIIGGLINQVMPSKLKLVSSSKRKNIPLIT